MKRPFRLKDKSVIYVHTYFLVVLIIEPSLHLAVVDVARHVPEVSLDEVCDADHSAVRAEAGAGGTPLRKRDRCCRFGVQRARRRES